jgi:hypothetical protein
MRNSKHLLKALFLIALCTDSARALSDHEAQFDLSKPRESVPQPSGNALMQDLTTLSV